MEDFANKSNNTNAWEAFLFAEDLTCYVLKFLGVSWKPSFSYSILRDELETTFSPEIGKAVSLFPVYFNSQLENMKAELTRWFLSSPRHFERFVYYLSDEIFSSDLFLEFLMFCGCVVCLAEHLYRIDHPEFLEYAVTVISATYENKLRLDFYEQGGWKAFNNYCLKFVSAENLRSGVYPPLQTEIDRKQEFAENYKILSINDIIKMDMGS